MDPYIGQLLLVPYEFAPRGWAFCQGQLLPIQSNTALFSLLGTTFGGDGITNFALPDLRGRVPMSSGQGPGLSFRTLGEKFGNEAITLISQQMPQHNHLVNTFSQGGGAPRPVNAFLAQATAGNVYNATSDGSTLNPQAVGMAGNSQPHENIQPSLVLNWIIALEGIYPPRN